MNRGSVWWNILQPLLRDDGCGDSIATGKIYYAVTKDTGLCVHSNCNNVKTAWAQGLLVDI